VKTDIFRPEISLVSVVSAKLYHLWNFCSENKNGNLTAVQ
jgi:hypothetical protein